MPTIESDLLKANSGSDYVPREMGVPGPSRPADEPREEPKPQVDQATLKEQTTLAKTLERLNDRVTTESQAAKLLADPEIRAILDARERGEKFKLVRESEASTKPAASEPPKPSKNIEEMTNAELSEYMSQTIVHRLSSVLGDTVDAKIGSLRNELKPTLESVASAAQRDQSLRVQQEIKACADKHPDFDEMRLLMAKVNETVQGATVEELYMLAKVRAGTPAVPQKEIQTERPTAAPSQRQSFKRPTNVRGRQGMSDILDAALTRNELGASSEE